MWVSWLSLLQNVLFPWAGPRSVRPESVRALPGCLWQDVPADLAGGSCNLGDGLLLPGKAGREAGPLASSADSAPAPGAPL